MPLKHSDNIEAGIAELRKFRDRLFKSMKLSSEVDDGAMYPLDLITHIVAKRAVSTAAAFANLVEQHNMLCARTLLRTQIDSVIRLYAFSLVVDPHLMATQVLEGQHIRRIKDRHGSAMTDAYLVKSLGKDIEWLTRVYDNTSGFIHLSDKFIGLTMKVQDEGKLSIEITETDNMPDASWEEVIECFLATSNHLLQIIDSWVDKKHEVAVERAQRSTGQ